ncbi:universal stress protein [Streptomyces sp. enrichment culture]|uniref:universal stress protein n=1 Tax=Streptomyces sp. enrichment culture TaxID=1795815 RepID=UPI003F5767FA
MESPEPVPLVVVGVDGSPASYEALRWAARYAELVGGEVEAIHAWDTWVTPSWGGRAVEPDLDLEQARYRFGRALEAAFPGERPPGLRERLIDGDPSEVLIRASERADLLVVGHRGRGGFARTMLGSVSTRCAQHALCPVVVVRENRRS